VLSIDKHHDELSRKCKMFFNSTDNKATIKKALDEIHDK